jgi:hypothetical protein
MQCGVASGPGIGTKELYSEAGRSEYIVLLKWEARARCPALVRPGGEEVSVLEGTLADEVSCYPSGTWIRNLGRRRPRIFL